MYLLQIGTRIYCTCQCWKYSNKEKPYRNNINELYLYLEKQFYDRYIVWNLSSHELNTMVHVFEEKVINVTTTINEDRVSLFFPMPVEQLINIVQSISAWLKMDDKNIVVIHCRDGKQYSGLLVSCLLYYIGCFDDVLYSLGYFIQRVKEFEDDFDNEHHVFSNTLRQNLRYFGDAMLLLKTNSLATTEANDTLLNQINGVKGRMETQIVLEKIIIGIGHNNKIRIDKVRLDEVCKKNCIVEIYENNILKFSNIIFEEHNGQANEENNTDISQEDLEFLTENPDLLKCFVNMNTNAQKAVRSMNHKDGNNIIFSFGNGVSLEGNVFIHIFCYRHLTKKKDSLAGLFFHSGWIENTVSRFNAECIDTQGFSRMDMFPQCLFIDIFAKEIIRNPHHSEVSMRFERKDVDVAELEQLESFITGNVEEFLVDTLVKQGNSKTLSQFALKIFKNDIHKAHEFLYGLKSIDSYSDLFSDSPMPIEDRRSDTTRLPESGDNLRDTEKRLLEDASESERETFVHSRDTLSPLRPSNNSYSTPPPPPRLPSRIKTKVSEKLVKKPKSTLHWNEIKEKKQAEGSLWEEFLKGPEKNKESIGFDKRVFEELFCIDSDSRDRPHKFVQSKKSSEEKIGILDIRRSNNIAIGCSNLIKKFTSEELYEAIIHREESLTLDDLLNLKPLLPTPQERNLYLSMKGNNVSPRGPNDNSPRKEDRSVISSLSIFDVDEFMLRMSQEPNLVWMVDALITEKLFETECTMLYRQIDMLTGVLDLLRTDAKIKCLLKSMLDLGNLVKYEYGGRGNGLGVMRQNTKAIGFRLGGLNKLKEFRGKNSKVTLLHYLVNTLKQTSPDTLDLPNTFVPILNEVCSYDVPNIEKNCHNLGNSLRRLRKGPESTFSPTKHIQNFVSSVSIWIANSESSIHELTEKLNSYKAIFRKTSYYFGENPDASSPELLFNIWKGFFLNLRDVVNEVDLNKALFD